jgi:hypothetical protein
MWAGEARPISTNEEGATGRLAPMTDLESPIRCSPFV